MPKKFLQYAVMVVIIIGVTVFLRTFVSAALYVQPEAEVGYPYFMAPNASSTEAIKAASSTEQKRIAAKLTPDGPTRLMIPILDINATVQRVGLNKRGAMGVPSNYKDVAWYSAGAVPGNIGSAVIAGHLDNALGLSGVFKNLSQIKVGDEILATTVSGKKQKFLVTNLTEFDYNDPRASVIFDNNHDKALLHLVTCGGNWVPEHKTYDKRLIVTAELAK